MAEAAEAAGVKTQVNFNYLCNPILGLARDMISAGELGEIRGYRGVHAEDYMADSAGPFTFRHDPDGRRAGRHRQPCIGNGRVPVRSNRWTDH